MSLSGNAVVVGSGPNGLAAAVALARTGIKVTLFERNAAIGGGTRTEELTLPGFRHDVCSAVHPLGVASPFFRTLPLQRYGLEWLHPEIALAHPLPEGGAALLYNSVERTAHGLGGDAAAYRRLMTPLVHRWQDLADDLLAPLHVPRHPLLMAAFALKGVLPADYLANSVFKGIAARALFAGLAAHSFLALTQPLSAAFGLILGALAHVAGWPVAKGGSARIAQALAGCLRSLGGEIITSREIVLLDELEGASTVMLDVTPHQLLGLAGRRLPDGYHRRLERYRYGSGVFKIDWALREAIPWKAEECRRAVTVHVGGRGGEISQGEGAVRQGQHPERPFVLLVQPTVVDPSRAPEGHVAWGYCHVPNGSTMDMTEAIERQIERFAPGFRDVVLARHTRNCLEYQAYNPNLIGGDINGGMQDIRQFLVRPTLLHPYRTPLKGVYLCSSSTPPGGGVHGMCGYHAATAAVRDSDKGR